MAEDQSARFKARPGQEVPFESFGDAFKRHKAAGRAEFPWRGKTYSTKTAQEQGREIGARASGSGRGTAGGMGASDRVVLRPDPYADTSRVMEGVAAKQREMSRPGRDAIENVYPETALIPATRLGPLAARAAQAIRGAMASSGRASEAERVASRIEPRMRRSGESLEESTNQARAEMAREPRMRRSGESVEKSTDQARAEMAREPRMRRSGESLEESTNQARAEMAREPRMRRSGEAVDDAMKQARMDMAREPQLEPARALSAAERQPSALQGNKTSTTPRSRTRETDEGVEFKRGGKTKAYAKGGSVKGAGCEQRGLRKCKVY